MNTDDWDNFCDIEILVDDGGRCGGSKPIAMNGGSSSLGLMRSPSFRYFGEFETSSSGSSAYKGDQGMRSNFDMTDTDMVGDFNFDSDCSISDHRKSCQGNSVTLEASNKNKKGLGNSPSEAISKLNEHSCKQSCMNITEFSRTSSYAMHQISKIEDIYLTEEDNNHRDNLNRRILAPPTISPQNSVNMDYSSGEFIFRNYEQEEKVVVNDLGTLQSNNNNDDIRHNFLSNVNHEIASRRDPQDNLRTNKFGDSSRIESESLPSKRSLTPELTKEVIEKTPSSPRSHPSESPASNSHFLSFMYVRPSSLPSYSKASVSVASPPPSSSSNLLELKIPSRCCIPSITHRSVFGYNSTVIFGGNNKTNNKLQVYKSTAGRKGGVSKNHSTLTRNTFLSLPVRHTCYAAPTDVKAMPALSL